MAKYTDIDFALNKNELTNDIGLKTDINAIGQSIKNIILTFKTEKIFDPTFGGNGYDLLFELLSSTKKNAAISTLTAELNSQEPRAIIRTINIEDSGTGELNISVTFSPVFDANITRTLGLQINVTVNGEQ